MKKTISLLIIAFIFPIIVFSQQTLPSKIEKKKVLGGYNFYMSGEKLNNKELLNAVKSNDFAYKEMKVALKNYRWGSVLGTSGGFLIGWELGSMATGNKFSWEIATIGGSLAIISVPFTISAFKKAINAVDLYNNSIDKSTSRKQFHSKINFCIIRDIPGIQLTVSLL